MQAFKALLNADAMGYAEGTPLVTKRSGRVTADEVAEAGSGAAAGRGNGGAVSGELTGEAGVDRGAAGATPACAAGAGRRIACMQGTGGGTGSGEGSHLAWVMILLYYCSSLS